MFAFTVYLVSSPQASEMKSFVNNDFGFRGGVLNSGLMNLLSLQYTGPLGVKYRFFISPY